MQENNQDNDGFWSNYPMLLAIALLGVFFLSVWYQEWWPTLQAEKAQRQLPYPKGSEQARGWRYGQELLPGEHCGQVDPPFVKSPEFVKACEEGLRARHQGAAEHNTAPRMLP